MSVFWAALYQIKTQLHQKKACDFYNLATYCINCSLLKKTLNEDVVSHSCAKRLLINCTANQLKLSFLSTLEVPTCYLSLTRTIFSALLMPSWLLFLRYDCSNTDQLRSGAQLVAYKLNTRRAATASA